MKSRFIVNNPYVVCLVYDRKLGKKFRGIAKCQPEDIFSEEKGKTIAQLKAEIYRENYRSRKALAEAGRIAQKALSAHKECVNRAEIYFNNRLKKQKQLETLLQA